MVKKFLCLFFFIFGFFLILRQIYAFSYPSPSGFVNNFADLYSADFKAKLEQNLSNFEKDTSSEIAVATIKSLEGMDIETYAVELFEKWGIGKKDKDNGLLILIAKDERKVRIEVGYGLEPYITDGRAGEIIRNQISPEFKKENYEAGTLAAVEQIKKYILDKDIAPKESEKGNDSGFWIVIGFLFVFYLIATYLASYLGRTKEIWPGGAIGAILGGLGGLLFGSILAIILGALFLGAIGLLFDFVLTKNYQSRKVRGLPTDFWHTWGGFKSGGGGGDSFGGFGGGSSGGGGASGGW